MIGSKDTTSIARNYNDGIAKRICQDSEEIPVGVRFEEA
jgi:hypothetical protein